MRRALNARTKMSLTAV